MQDVNTTPWLEISALFIMLTIVCAFNRTIESKVLRRHSVAKTIVNIINTVKISNQSDRFTCYIGFHQVSAKSVKLLLQFFFIDRSVICVLLLKK